MRVHNLKTVGKKSKNKKKKKSKNLKKNKSKNVKKVDQDIFGSILAESPVENKVEEIVENKIENTAENKVEEIADNIINQGNFTQRSCETAFDDLGHYMPTDYKIENTSENKVEEIAENKVEEIQKSKNSENSCVLRPYIYPSVQGFEKVTLFVKTFFEVIKNGFEEKEITEIPVFDAAKYGEIVNFVPPENFDVVEQTWVSKPYALISILYNKKTRKRMYYVSEPVLDSLERALLQHVYNNLKVILLEHVIDFNNMNKELVLYNNFIKILDIYGIGLDSRSLQKIWYYIKRNYVGYEKLDALLKDPMIEDISCVGANIPVYLYHRKYTNIETNIIFEEDELNTTIMKLAQMSGKSISTGYPIVNARLPEGSRLEATLGREVTTRGGTITIRKFRDAPFTPVDLIKYGTFNTEIMAYLWLAAENNKSMMFVGGTASGKTTTLNAVSLFIPSESKIITIEDTRELTLSHKNWIAGVVRETFMGQEAAPIDMFELLRSALRQRPEYLIVGEIRGKEAHTLFQAMSTGHTTFSTMHADSAQLAVNRLLNEPINVPLMMLSSLDIIAVQVMRYVGRKRVRRLESLSEFAGIDATTQVIKTRELYKWNQVHDIMEQCGSSIILDDIMNSRGWSREQLKKELDNREAVLHYMVDNDIHDYKDTSLIIRMYTSDPENVMDLIREGKPFLSESKWV